MPAPKGVTTASGKSYLTVSLQDATGTMDAKKWDIGPSDEEIFAPGNIVRSKRKSFPIKTPCR
jgi:23S rRNA maturation-related 3'-5' exoribonuclease YhaM